MDLQKEIDNLKVKAGYDGKPQQWQYGFDLACRELAKAQATPEGFVLVPEVLTHEQAARISDDENFFETYQTILTESDTGEDSAVILIQTAHKAMIEALEQDYESK